MGLRRLNRWVLTWLYRKSTALSAVLSAEFSLMKSHLMFSLSLVRQHGRMQSLYEETCLLVPECSMRHTSLACVHNDLTSPNMQCILAGQTPSLMEWVKTWARHFAMPTGSNKKRRTPKNRNAPGKQPTKEEMN